ncbi:uncharacterized protein LOC132795222 [Drosophila nasuta]|uniref:uncharacterized protein LOC132795222 n=1 Tax=Drosophila nasuta TaxID=42062 RepID=UPI00295EE4EA|nr:uncharacterized protein LOC132795222 [Drosophila nasuta]
MSSSERANSHQVAPSHRSTFMISRHHSSSNSNSNSSSSSWSTLRAHTSFALIGALLYCVSMPMIILADLRCRLHSPLGRHSSNWATEQQHHHEIETPTQSETETRLQSRRVMASFAVLCLSFFLFL